jgi:hypothetical protein
MTRLPLPRLLSLLPALALLGSTAGAAVTVTGETAAWHPVTLSLTGPATSETATPNPFFDVRLVVRFESGDTSYEVPGFYAADGNAAQTGADAGNVWRARFVPDRPGEWRYTVSFRSGEGIAVSDEPDAGIALEGDGTTGTIEVEADEEAPGSLRYVGERYLRFAASGRWFLKAGADSPENFLAYAGFDGMEARAVAGEERDGEAALSPLHAYEPHVRDFRDGDPTWRGGRGKGIIGALNYLAGKGVNSVYFLTMNVEGDGKDVWPWRTADERFRFDCSKLDQWEIVFSHMDRLGIALHVVLTETENESLLELEEGGVFFAERRELYYRELVARFGHHRAVVWNLGEENGWDDRGKGSTGRFGLPNSHEQRQAFADALRALDPYDHPIVVHTLPGRQDDIYTPLLGHESLEGASLQIHDARDVYAETLKWIERSGAKGRRWVVSFDELGPAEDGVLPDEEDPDHDVVRHQALWGNLMAGGAGCEWYFGYKHAHNDLGLEDYRSRERMWDQTRSAVEFFQEHLPFPEMKALTGHLSREDGWVFAKPGHVYAVYLPPTPPGASAPEPARLWLPSAEYTVSWFDPQGGGALRGGSVTAVSGPGARALGQPPGNARRDWVVLVRLNGHPPRDIPLPRAEEMP